MTALIIDVLSVLRRNMLKKNEAFLLMGPPTLPANISEWYPGGLAQRDFAS